MSKTEHRYWDLDRSDRVEQETPEPQTDRVEAQMNVFRWLVDDVKRAHEKDTRRVGFIAFILGILFAGVVSSAVVRFLN